MAALPSKAIRRKVLASAGDQIGKSRSLPVAITYHVSGKSISSSFHARPPEVFKWDWWAMTSKLRGCGYRLAVFGSKHLSDPTGAFFSADHLPAEQTFKHNYMLWRKMSTSTDKWETILCLSTLDRVMMRRLIKP